MSLGERLTAFLGRGARPAASGMRGGFLGRILPALGGVPPRPLAPELPPKDWDRQILAVRPRLEILDDIGRSTQSTVIACAVYFWARLAHVIIYALGIPVLRTLAFAAGFAAQVALVAAVFGKL